MLVERRLSIFTACNIKIFGWAESARNFRPGPFIYNDSVRNFGPVRKLRTIWNFRPPTWISRFCKNLKDLQSKCMSWNSVLATHLSNQNYEICIRRTSGSCRICYWPQTTGTSGSESDQVWFPIMQKILSVVPQIPVR